MVPPWDLGGEVPAPGLPEPERDERLWPDLSVFGDPWDLDNPGRAGRDPVGAVTSGAARPGVVRQPAGAWEGDLWPGARARASGREPVGAQEADLPPEAEAGAGGRRPVGAQALAGLSPGRGV